MASKPKVVQKEKAPKKNPYKQELSETQKNEIKKAQMNKVKVPVTTVSPNNVKNAITDAVSSVKKAIEQSDIPRYSISNKPK